MAAAYDAIAGWYDQSVHAPGSLAARVADQVIELCGDVAGRNVCDLACGQGLAARLPARRGARVTGIDLSTRLVEMARREEQAEPLGVQYQTGDAQVLDEIPADRFDGVACSLALMDIPDLAAVIRTVRRVLRSGGWFIFSITHPCFQLPASPANGVEAALVSEEEFGYYATRFWRSDYPHGVRGQVGAYHRPLSTYLNTLSDAGFAPERLVEPRSPEEMTRRDAAGVPLPKFLIVRCRKG